MQPTVHAILAMVADPPASTTDAVSQWLVALILVGVFVILTVEAAHRVLVLAGAVSLVWLLTYLTPVEAAQFRGLGPRPGPQRPAPAGRDDGAGRGAQDDRSLSPPGGTSAPRQWRATAPDPTVALLGDGTAVGPAGQCDHRDLHDPDGHRRGAAAAGPARGFLLPLIMAANIGGTATLIGDPPNVMIGSGADLSFLAFIKHLTVPVLVMMVVIGAYARRYYGAAIAGKWRAERGDGAGARSTPGCCAGPWSFWRWSPGVPDPQRHRHAGGDPGHGRGRGAARGAGHPLSPAHQADALRNGRMACWPSSSARSNGRRYRSSRSCSSWSGRRSRQD